MLRTNGPKRELPIRAKIVNKNAPGCCPGRFFTCNRILPKAMNHTRTTVQQGS